MPTSTFYNLPEIKREKLINAIRNEFSKNTFDKIASQIKENAFQRYNKSNDKFSGGFLDINYRGNKIISNRQFFNLRGFTTISYILADYTD